MSFYRTLTDVKKMICDKSLLTSPKCQHQWWKDAIFFSKNWLPSSRSKDLPLMENRCDLDFYLQTAINNALANVTIAFCNQHQFAGCNQFHFVFNWYCLLFHFMTLRPVMIWNYLLHCNLFAFTHTSKESLNLVSNIMNMNGWKSNHLRLKW